MTDQTPYTPSLEEVRDVALLGAMDAAESNGQELDNDEFLAMFDRFIAHVRAETLREAGRFLRGSDNPQRGSDYRRESYVMDDAGYHLFHRANRIEQGENDD